MNELPENVRLEIEQRARNWGVPTVARRHMEEVARIAIEECWQAIDAMIVRGELPGNGADKSAQRNGLILASNKLFEMGAYGRSKESRDAAKEQT